MSIVTLKLQKQLAIVASRRAHGRWVKSVGDGGRTAASLKSPLSAGARTLLEAQLRKQINTSRSLHGAWRAAVVKIQKIDMQLQHLRPHNVTTCSLALAKAVALFEGGQSSDGLFRAYQDAVGVWTIGYGHTSADGAPVPGPGTRPLTQAEATTLLLHDLNIAYAPAVASALKLYGWAVPQKVFDSLTSFCYNLGPGYFSTGHDIGQAMQAHNLHLLASRMLEYNHAGGNVLAGLTRRRQWESQLLLGGTYTVS